MKFKYILPLLILFFASCQSSQRLVSYPQKDGMLYFTKSNVQKSKEITSFECDFTIYANDNQLLKETIFNYSLCIPNYTKKQLQEVKISVSTDDFNSQIIELNDVKIIYIEQIKENSMKLRQTSKISVADSTKILENSTNLKVKIETKTNSIILQFPEMNKNLFNINTYIF